MINNLKIKMFIDINILIYKNIDLFISTRIGYINNYYILINLNIILSIRSFIK